MVNKELEQKKMTIMLGVGEVPIEEVPNEDEILVTSTDRGKQRLKERIHSNRIIEYTGDNHLITIAPTGSGKGRSVIIPNLLTYQGPIIVIDPKGENYSVTANARRRMGHKVIKLDPFGISKEVDNIDSDGLNPLDIFELDGHDIESDSQMLAELLSVGNRFGTDPFWDIHSMSLYSALITYTVTTKSKEEQNLNSIRSILFSSDVDYNLAVILDTIGKKLNKMAYDQIASYLNLPSDKTRPGVLGTASSYMSPFLSENVSKTLNKSSFSLNDIVTGQDLSIYLIIPPDKLRSHSALLRLWIGTLLKAIISRGNRKKQYKNRTLFVLDECGQLGYFPYLEYVITLCRGYGLQTWSFWQDINQIKKIYEASWLTMVNNSAILQLFGANNFNVASEFSDLLGVYPDGIINMKNNELAIVTSGIPPYKLKKIDYLTDSMFKDAYDNNPFYDNDQVK